MKRPLINLKPCPFCGGVPHLYGIRRRDYVQPVTKDIAEQTDNGWAKGEAEEFWIQPFCRIGCVLGAAYSNHYGIVGGVHYKTKEAAAKAWNKRYDDEDTGDDKR